jgi:hypothetical protein
MRKFFDELRTNLDVETVATAEAAAAAERDSTAPKVSDDDLSQIAGEGSFFKKYFNTKCRLFIWSTTTPTGCFSFGCFVYKCEV